VPGFFTQDFERASPDGTSLRPVGEPYFAVRFTPTELGTYRYRIIATGQGARDTGQVMQVASAWFTLKVTSNPQGKGRGMRDEGREKGFVRRGKFWHYLTTARPSSPSA